MHVTTQFRHAREIAADWLIAALWENEPLAGAVAELDATMDRQLTRLLENGDVTGKAKETTALYEPRGLAAQRLLIVGLGPRAKIEPGGLFAAGAAAARAVTTKAHQRLAFVLPDAGAKLDIEAMTVLLGAGLQHGSESAGLRKNKPDRFAPKELCMVAAPGAGREA